jgi:intein/homing endonuclease
MADNKNKFSNEPFFQRLTRLFRSGPAIQRRIKGIDPKNYYGSQLIRGNFGYRAAAPFGFGRENSPFSVLGAYGILDRMSRYSEYSAMEYMPEIATALDLYADETVGGNDRGHCFHIYSDNTQIKQALDELFYDTLNVEFNLRPWIRNLVKFGDIFLFLEVLPDIGIINTFPIPVNEIEREEGFDPEDPYAVRFKWITRGNKYLENWQVAHLRLLSNDLFMPYGTCLSYDTKISTEFGFKEIKDIKIGDKVKTFDIKTQKPIISNVLDVINSGEKECFNIRTKHSFIEASKEHRILICNNNEFSYKFVSELKIGDRLVINNVDNKGKKIQIDKQFFDFNKNGYQNNVNCLPDFVDEDFASLFGFLLGDGWKKQKNVYFALGIKNEINEKYSNLLEKFSGKNKKFITVNNRKTTVYVNSKMLSTILSNMGFEGYSTTKRIPKWVFESEYNIRKSFLDGFHAADGSSNVDKWGCERKSIELANEQLIKDLKILAQTLGYKTGKISFRERKNTFIAGRKIKKINKSFSFYYFESQNLQTKKYDNKNRISKDYILEPIIEIQNIGFKETWDIYVDNDNHNFYANEVVVHNSILESARSVYRKLTMLEDAMLTYRIVRSPERRVFYIDVGNMPVTDVDSYMEAIKSTMKSQGITDRSNGREDLRYQSMSVTDDFYIPRRGANDSTKIESLPGGQHVSAIEDVEYMQKKLFSAVKVPKPYLNYTENLGAKASLSQIDIRFSRTIQSVQKIAIAELNKLAMIHLFTKGFDGADLINFELKLSNPSSVALQQRLELWSVKFDTAGKANETKLVDQKWIQKHILELTPDDVAEVETGLKKDKIREKELDDLELTPVDPRIGPKTTDTFDPSNYDSPSPVVPRTKMEDPEVDNRFNREISLSKYRSYDEDGNSYVVDLETNKSPIKATPFLTRAKRNRVRREGESTGRSNTAMPDMAAMLSPKNKYTKDVYGLKTEDNNVIKNIKHLKDVVEASEDLLSDTSRKFSKGIVSNIDLEPSFNNEMKSIFKKLKVIKETTKTNKLLTEEFNVDLSNIEQELSIEKDGNDLLLEIINENNIAEKKSITNKDEIQKIKEKTLADVFDSDE